LWPARPVERNQQQSAAGAVVHCTSPTHCLAIAVRIVTVPDAMRAELRRGVYPRLY